jgi:ligand-binding sensor domain-containing protein
MSFAGKGETSILTRLCLLCLLIPLLLAGSASAVNPNNHISQYAHTAWRVQDGNFTGTTRVLAQTTDGYLWIGTTAGLFRFDGVRFIQWNPPGSEKLPSQRINSLLGSSDGSLWIGTSVGLSRWKADHLTNYQGQRAVVAAILEDKDTNIWIVFARSSDKTPLCRVEKSEMRCYGRADGISPGFHGLLAKDAAGNFWIGGQGDNGLIRWRPDSHESYPLKGDKNADATVVSVALEPDYSLWAGIDVLGPGFGLQRLVHGVWKAFSSPELDGSKVAVQALLLDRHNALWVGTIKHGIYRVFRDKVEHFGSSDGLSSDYVFKFIEDREGNLWVATSRGIDNFRDLRIITFSTPEGLTAEEVNSVRP